MGERNTRGFYLDSFGRSLTRGRSIVQQRMGAVWLLIHMERNSPRYITANKNFRGEFPNLFCIQAAARSSSWHLEKADERVYPPSKSI